MDAFEKWFKSHKPHHEWDIHSEMKAAFTAGKDEGIKEGMRKAAEIVRQNPKEVALQVRPYEPISAENVSLLMDDAREACAALSLAILAEADK